MAVDQPIVGYIVILKRATGAEGAKFPLVKGAPCVIGRAESCNVCVSNKCVSRRHAEIVVEDDGRIVLHSLSQTNPTVVNDQIARSHVLVDGDQFEIGSGRLFRFQRAETGIIPKSSSKYARTQTPSVAFRTESAENRRDSSASSSSGRRALRSRKSTPFRQPSRKKIRQSVPNPNSTPFTLDSRQRRLSEIKSSRTSLGSSNERKPLRSALKTPQKVFIRTPVSKPAETLETYREGNRLFQAILKHSPGTKRHIYYSETGWDIDAMVEDLQISEIRMKENRDPIYSRTDVEDIAVKKPDDLEEESADDENDGESETDAIGVGEAEAEVEVEEAEVQEAEVEEADVEEVEVEESEVQDAVEDGQVEEEVEVDENIPLSTEPRNVMMSPRRAEGHYVPRTCTENGMTFVIPENPGSSNMPPTIRIGGMDSTTTTTTSATDTSQQKNRSRIRTIQKPSLFSSNPMVGITKTQPNNRLKVSSSNAIVEAVNELNGDKSLPKAVRSSVNDILTTFDAMRTEPVVDESSSSSTPSSRALTPIRTSTPRRASPSSSLTGNQSGLDTDAMFDGLEALFKTPAGKSARKSIDRIFSTMSNVDIVTPPSLSKRLKSPESVTDCLGLLFKSPSSLKKKERQSLKDSVVESLSNVINSPICSNDPFADDPGQVDRETLERISVATNTEVDLLPESIATHIEPAIAELIDEDDDYSEALSRLFQTPRKKLARKISNHIYEGLELMVKSPGNSKLSHQNRVSIGDSLNLVMGTPIDQVSEVLRSVPAQELVDDDDQTDTSVKDSKSEAVPPFTIFDGFCQLMPMPKKLLTLAMARIGYKRHHGVLAETPSRIQPRRKRARIAPKTPEDEQFQPTDQQIGFEVGTAQTRDPDTPTPEMRYADYESAPEDASSPKSFDVESNQYFRASFEVPKAPLPTPVRENIRSRVPSKRAEVKKPLNTPLRRSIRDAKRPSKPEVKKALNTPARKQIRTRPPRPSRETKKPLNTPLAKAIKAQPHPAQHEVKKPLNTPLRKAIKDQTHPAKPEMKKALNTPLRKAIKDHPREAKPETKKPLNTPLAKDIRAHSRPSRAELKKALDTPTRKAIRSQPPRATRELKKSLTTPIRAAVRKQPQRERREIKKPLKTPLKKSIKAVVRKAPAQLKKPLATPIRSEIEEGSRRLPRKVMKPLDTPLRSAIETGSRRLKPPTKSLRSSVKKQIQSKPALKPLKQNKMEEEDTESGSSELTEPESVPTEPEVAVVEFVEQTPHTRRSTRIKSSTAKPSDVQSETVDTEELPLVTPRPATRLRRSTRKTPSSSKDEKIEIGETPVMTPRRTTLPRRSTRKTKAEEVQPEIVDAGAETDTEPNDAPSSDVEDVVEMTHEVNASGQKTGGVKIKITPVRVPRRQTRSMKKKTAEERDQESSVTDPKSEAQTDDDSSQSSKGSPAPMTRRELLSEWKKTKSKTKPKPSAKSKAKPKPKAVKKSAPKRKTVAKKSVAAKVAERPKRRAAKRGRQQIEEANTAVVATSSPPKSSKRRRTSPVNKQVESEAKEVIEKPQAEVISKKRTRSTQSKKAPQPSRATKSVKASTKAVSSRATKATTRRSTRKAEKEPEQDERDVKRRRYATRSTLDKGEESSSSSSPIAIAQASTSRRTRTKKAPANAAPARTRSTRLRSTRGK